MSKFIKDLFSIGLSKGLVILLSLGKSVLTARLLSAEANGVIAALAVYPQLFMSFGSLGISQATTFYTGKKQYSDSNLKRAIVQIWFISTIISLISCFILIRFFCTSGTNILWATLSIIPIPFTLFNTYNSGYFLGKNEISKYNKINWIPSAITLISILILLDVFNYDITGVLIAAVLGPLILSIHLAKSNLFLKNFSFTNNIDAIKSLLSLGLIYAGALLIINLNYKVDVIMLDGLSTNYQLGVYTKGVSLTEYLWQIPMLFGTIVFSRSAVSKDDRAFSSKVCQLLRLCVVAIGLTSIILMFFSKEIIVLLYGEKFIESALVQVILLPGVLLLTFFKVLNMDMAGKGKPWISIKAMGPALVINILLNYLTIPKYGANGAAFSSLVSYSIAAVMFLAIYSKETSIPVRLIFKYSRHDFEIFKTFLGKNKSRL